MQPLTKTQCITEPLPPLPDPRQLKPSLVQLINRHHTSMIHLAQAAHVQLDVVRAMVRGEPVMPVIAMQVLDGFRMLTGAKYTLSDVDIAVLAYWSYQ